MVEGLQVMSAAVHYREFLARLVLPWLGDDPIEVGSGIGDYAETWAGWGKGLVATEPQGSSLTRLQTRFSGDPRVTVRALDLPSDDTSDHSAAAALNVLEHIEDDVAALRSMARLVRPGGLVVVIVPAFPFAFGEWDRRIGHYRRYRLPDIRAKLAAAALRPIEIRYTNAPGLLGWWLVVRALGGQPRDTHLLRLYDRFAVPLIEKAERLIRPPFGQSVLAVAQTLPS